jgi:hypothetical protein
LAVLNRTGVDMWMFKCYRLAIGSTLLLL